MSEWKSPVQPVRCKVDLTAPLTVRRERGVLVQGDENANAIVAEVYQANGVPYNLTGATVTLTFVRPDNLAAPPITAEITGENHHIAVATLTDTCYRYSGQYAASLKLHHGETERTIVRIIGDIISTQNDGTVDDEQLFPTPEELLETLVQVETARQNAETAANRANNAAARAEQLQIDASGLAGDSNKLGGKAPEYYLPAVNLFKNPDFAVAQAGYGGYQGNARYAADGWPAINISEYLYNNGIYKLKPNGNGYIYQNIALKKLKGNAYTLAVKIRNGYLSVRVSTNNGIVNAADATAGSEWRTIIVNFNVDPVSTSLLQCQFYMTNSGSVELTEPALYPGTYTADTMPPFVPTHPRVESLKLGNPVQPVQLLANSDWRIKKNIVNQHGQDEYVGNMLIYTIDRWKTGIWNEKGTVLVQNGYIELVGGIDNTPGSFFQEIEQSSLVVGKPYTFAVCLLDGTIIAGSFTMTNNNSYTERAKVGNVTLVTTGSDGPLRLLILADANSSAKLHWAALYEGAYTAETLPPFVPRPYAVELAECQQYVFIPPKDYDYYLHGLIIDTNTIRAVVPVPAEMRNNTNATVDLGIVGWVRGGGKFMNVSLTVNNAYAVGNELVINLVASGDELPLNQMCIIKVTGFAVYLDL